MQVPTELEDAFDALLQTCHILMTWGIAPEKIMMSLAILEGTIVYGYPKEQQKTLNDMSAQYKEAIQKQIAEWKA